MILQTIELDCAPGFPRPGDLLPALLKGTSVEPREPVSKFFGCWQWDYCDIPPAEWQQVQKTVKPRIEALYAQGRIRYGSW
jgi:hypothetical protein